jgi:hypothetical protein
MLENPYCETIMIRQEPTHTNMWVRIPAAQSNRSRSNPIRLPSAAAATSRMSISESGIVTSENHIEACAASSHPRRISGKPIFGLSEPVWRGKYSGGLEARLATGQWSRRLLIFRE